LLAKTAAQRMQMLADPPLSSERRPEQARSHNGSAYDRKSQVGHSKPKNIQAGCKANIPSKLPQQIGHLPKME